MFNLTEAAQRLGLTIQLLVEMSGKIAQFQFLENGAEVSRHATVFQATRWLDGYRRGISRQESLDRSVC